MNAIAAPLPMTTDDERDVFRARNDPAAFAPIYERHAAAVYRMCLRACGDPDLADDLTSRTFLLAMERLDRYQPQPTATFRSWLFTIARNVARDHWRRDRRFQPLGNDHEVRPDDAPGPEMIALHRLELDSLRAALDGLNERHRSIVELRLSGLSQQEIADVMACTVSAVKSAQTRAFDNLRRILGERRIES